MELPKAYSTSSWHMLRLGIFGRDNGICQRCGCDCRYERWSVDHIEPRIKGGAFWDPANLQLLCYACHKIKTVEDRNTKPNGESMIYYEQLNRALAYDWVLTTEIKGSKQSVLVARRILGLLVGDINPSAWESNRAIAPRRINISIKYICETLSIPRATVARGMKRLIENGQIERLYMGCYEVRLPDTPSNSS